VYLQLASAHPVPKTLDVLLQTDPERALDEVVLEQFE
jgi:hypothetical protein